MEEGLVIVVNNTTVVLWPQCYSRPERNMATASHSPSTAAMM